jgi:MFS family permease
VQSDAHDRLRLERLSLLLVAAFVNGGAIMVVEILGTRVLGPFFGVGLFVWSSLLAVALVALAIGYYVGGHLADRRPEPWRVYALLVVAGCLVALIPLCAEYVLKYADALGIRGGALVSAVVLFGPGLTIAGMITTNAVRLATTDPAATGRSAGLVYAVSTLGGLFGTLLAGFVLVPTWAVHTTLAGTSALLVVTGICGLFVHRKEGLKLAALGILLPLSAFRPPDLMLAPEITVLERSESLVGRLSVVEDRSRGTPLRLLRADHSFIGGLWVDAKEPAFGFVHLLEAVRLARPEGQRLLLVGLGIGSVSTALAEVGVSTDVVEIDPEVVRMARAFFGYEPTGRVFVEDARTLIRRLDERYDFIVHDAFTGGSVPEHLLSVEVLRRLQQLLVPGGVLALNFVAGDNGQLAAPLYVVQSTLRAVFPHLRAFRDGPAEAASTLSNFVFFASDQPIVFQETDSFEGPACQRVLTNFQQWEVLQGRTSSAPVVTDAHNPMLRLTLPISEAFRNQMNQLYPPSFWLR